MSLTFILMVQLPRVKLPSVFPFFLIAAEDGCTVSNLFVLNKCKIPGFINYVILYICILLI